MGVFWREGVFFGKNLLDFFLTALCTATRKLEAVIFPGDLIHGAIGLGFRRGIANMIGGEGKSFTDF